MAESVSALLNFPTETFRQTLDQLHHRASSLVAVSLQWKDFDEHLASINAAAKERAKELQSNRESVKLRLEEVKNRERSIEGRERDLKIKEERIEEKRKEFDGKFKDLESKEKMIQEWEEEVQLEKNKYENLCKELESKQKQQINEVNHGYSSIIDGKSLQIYLNEHSREINSMRFSVSMALGHSTDPAMLVLDALQGFYPPHLKKSGIEFDSEVVRRSCSVLLEELMRLSPEIRAPVRKEARGIAADWVRKLKSDAKHYMEVLCFLQLLACYGLASAFNADKLLARLDIVANHRLAPALFRALGFTNKVSDFVNKLMGKKKLNEAIKFIYEFDMVGQFQPVSILNDFLAKSAVDTESLRKKDVTPEGQIKASKKRLADIKYALRCIKECRIDYGLAHKSLEQQVGFLEKEISKRKEAASLGDKIRELNDKKQHLSPAADSASTGNKRPRDYDAGQVLEQEISENKCPRTDAAMEKKLEASHGANQVYTSTEELKKLLEKNQLENGEIATALRCSLDPWRLVLDVIDVPIPFTPGENRDFEVHIPKSGCIHLLRQLREVAPEINPDIRDEAKKFVLHWESILRKKSNKSPLEAICFLQFLVSFKLGSVFYAYELLDFLDTDHWRKEVPDLCKDLGVTDEIPGFIRNKIKKEKYIEAVKYMYALNMVDELSPVSVLQICLGNSSKKTGKRPLEEQIAKINKEIKANKDVVKCIEDYKITGLSPKWLKGRITQLEKKKEELKRRPVSNGKPKPKTKHWNKHPRARNPPDYQPTRNSGGLSAMPLQHLPASYVSLYSPPRNQHVWPAYDPPRETELHGYGATVTPAYHWGALGNFRPDRPFHY